MRSTKTLADVLRQLPADHLNADSSLVRREPGVAVPTVAAGDVLGELAGTGRAICQVEVSDVQEVTALASLDCLGDKHPVELPS